ncbi:Legumain [Halotydeus destructor]|nr:Legumain [Halotydeus destructor]
MNSLFAIVTLALVAIANGSPVHFGNLVQPDPSFTGKQWVLLIAGSNGYDNYRHQADVYHAYQILTGHGIPESQIVVMHYDDIANNEENPVKGNVINRPDGPNVYTGVPKDYVGDDVTPDNALKALRGDKGLAAAGKKVIQSTEKDHIFIYFADHGATGLVAFPNDELQATDVNAALVQLNKDKKYAKLVIYLEACESGSMFDGILPKNINIYATTAANPDESSWAYYCDDTSGRDTCLGDEYSIHWLEDSDSKKSLAKETLAQQFKLVKNETVESTPHEYGDVTLSKAALSEFQGAKAKKVTAKPYKKTNPKDRVKSGDVPVVMALRRLEKATSEEERVVLEKKLKTILAGREYLTNFIRSLAKTIAKTVDSDAGANYLLYAKQRLTKHECSKQLYQAFDKHCFDISHHTYSMRHLHVFVNACERFNEAEIALTELAIVRHCGSVANQGHPYEQIV